MLLNCDIEDSSNIKIILREGTASKEIIKYDFNDFESHFNKNVNTNLRYKLGKNLSYDAKEVLEVTDPDDAYLPKLNVTTKYIFARDDDFFAYPNNYNYYVNFYKNTFQHGGISLEEVLIPIVKMKSKS